jgi:hypothetical protein
MNIDKEYFNKRLVLLFHMINVQERFHEKMYKHMNQCLLFEQNMDLGRKYTLNFYQNEIFISDVFYGLIN